MVRISETIKCGNLAALMARADLVRSRCKALGHAAPNINYSFDDTDNTVTVFAVLAPGDDDKGAAN